jgi:hypothetical protein
LRREGIAHHVADVVRDQFDVGDVKLVENAGEVARLCHLGVAVVRM